MTAALHDVVWWSTLVAGLTMSVVWRSRLGRGAAPAFAGFALLLAVAAVNLFWEPRPVAPASAGIFDVLGALEPAELAVMLAVYAAYPAGLALLLIAVLRTRTTEPTAGG